jgi:hypothetical protein
MTDVATIQAGVNGLIQQMLSKGLIKPESDFRIVANSESHISTSWEKAGAARTWDREYVYHHGPFDRALAVAQTAIAALPDLTERNKAAFLEKLDEVIALGRKTGIDVNYVNPLIETMKRLSENIITHQKAVS